MLQNCNFNAEHYMANLEKVYEFHDNPSLFVRGTVNTDRRYRNSLHEKNIL